MRSRSARRRSFRRIHAGAGAAGALLAAQAIGILAVARAGFGALLRHELGARRPRALLDARPGGGRRRRVGTFAPSLERGGNGHRGFLLLALLFRHAVGLNPLLHGGSRARTPIDVLDQPALARPSAPRKGGAPRWHRPRAPRRSSGNRARAARIRGRRPPQGPAPRTRCRCFPPPCFSRRRRRAGPDRRCRSGTSSGPQPERRLRGCRRRAA